MIVCGGFTVFARGFSGKWNLPAVLLGWCLVVPGFAATAGFAVTDAQGHWAESTYWVDARLRLALPAAAREALQNGVALTLAVEFELQPERTGWWQEKRWEHRWTYRLRYHALAQVYQVVSESEGVLRNYASLTQALLAIGLPEPLATVKREVLPVGTYQARLRVRLVTEDLPLPLRLQSYTSGEWQAISDWYSWSVVP